MANTNIATMKWFEGKGRVGIILTRSRERGYTAYIGVGLDVNEDYDAAFILRWGTKLTYEQAAPHFKRQLMSKHREVVRYDGKSY